MRYRWETGFWAFLLMRISGVALTVYLFLHINVLSNLLAGPEKFNEIMKTVQSPLFKLFEVALLAAVLFHALNGVRVLWIDFGAAAFRQKAWFWAVFVLAAALVVAGAVPILGIL
jgi:succinate dehydrogenase / fumarate reductase, cytochrome b subunit